MLRRRSFVCALVTGLFVLGAGCEPFASSTGSDGVDGGGGEDGGGDRADGAPSPDAAGSDAAPQACSYPVVCGPAKIACSAYDFNNGTCGPWAPDGSGSMTCSDGTLTVGAQDESDFFAWVTVFSPPSYQSVDIALSLVIEVWGNRPIVEFEVGATDVAELRATTLSSGDRIFQVCVPDEPSSCKNLGPLTRGSKHIVQVRTTAASTTVSVDCGAPAVLPGTPMTPSSETTIAFGALAADLIRGALDDAIISFE